MIVRTLEFRLPTESVARFDNSLLLSLSPREGCVLQPTQIRSKLNEGIVERVAGRPAGLLETRYVAYARHRDVLRIPTETRQRDSDADHELRQHRGYSVASAIQIGRAGAGSQAGRRQQQRGDSQLVVRPLDAATSAA